MLGRILGFEPSSPYAERLSRLEAAGIALWDLIASCEREGSLDKDIRGETPNPIAEYIACNPAVERLALNGGKAAASFASGAGRGLRMKLGETKIWAPLENSGRRILVARLPSSSPVPTMAYRKAEDKLLAWSTFLTASL